MTDIEVKQLIERLRQRSNSNYVLMSYPPKPAPDADCHMAADLLQEALAFKQEVSDAVVDTEEKYGAVIRDNFGHFIIPKPKPYPLEETLEHLGWYNAPKDADELRAALEARGLEIREKNDDQ